MTDLRVVILREKIGRCLRFILLSSDATPPPLSYHLYLQHREKKGYERGRESVVRAGLELNKTAAKKHGPLLIYILYAASPPDLLMEMHTNSRYFKFFDP